jgi:hypothetical protein
MGSEAAADWFQKVLKDWIDALSFGFVTLNG